MKKICKRILNRLCKLTSKHWLFVAIFITSSPWWFSLILTYFGETLGLIDVITDANKITGRKLSSAGLAITLVLLLLIIIITAINKYKETHDEEKNNAVIYMNWYSLLDKVLSSVDSVCEQKYNTQLKKIDELKSSGAEPPIVYSDPCVQLQHTIKELKECVAYMLSEKGRKFDSSDLYVSLAYNFPLENKDVWKWADISNERGLSLDSLLADNTTFRYAIHNATEQSPLIFFNSKEEARVQGCYIPDDDDNYDILHKLKGSIACCRISIKKYDTTYITAILSISSYDRQFVEVSNFKTKQEQDNEVSNVSGNMKRIPISEFSQRIRIELCNYYIQFLREKWEKSNNNTL